MITGLAGAGMYVMKLRADNATLKANQLKLETAVAEQNKVGKNAARCIELASGAEHTEEELKATLKSQINPECPALANPNFVHYE